MSSNKLVTLTAIDAFIALGAFGAWILMCVGVDGGVLSAFGLLSLRYFTVLSNLLMAAASLVCLTCEIPMLKSGRSSDLPKWVLILRLAGVNAVALTLTVVLGFLGPTIGYLELLEGPNFFLHLLIPVLAIASLAVFRLSEGISFKEALLGLVPFLLYAVFYLSNILINGVGEGSSSNDWYGFLGGDVSLIPVVIVIIGSVTLALALGLWKLGGGSSKAATPE